MATTTFNDLITFSRGSNATVTGPNGLIQWAPSNLLTNSQDFEAAAWGKSASGQVTVTANQAIAPDGSRTADLTVPNASSGYHSIRQGPTTSANVHAQSVYYKPSGYTKVAIREDFAVGQYASFDCTGAGTIIDKTAAASASITLLADGWYRITLTPTTTSANQGMGVYIMNAGYASGDPAAYTFTGDGTSGGFLWGAQLELGSTATTYNNTSVRNLLGFSEASDNAAWTKIGTSIVTGAQANPVNGLFNAQKLMEDTANSGHQINQGATTTANPFTFSTYAKPAGRNWMALGITDSGSTVRISYFDLANGVTGTVASGVTASIVSVGNGWYRCAVTVAAAAAGANVLRIYATNANNNTTYTGDGNSGVYIYGAMLSNSASLDPYVPTPGAAPSSTAYYGPRFDYDPVTLAARGLLVEEARTNLATYSNTFSDASWAAIGTKNLVANSTVSPDGEVNASTLTDNSAVAFQGASKSVTVANDNATYTASLYVRKTTGGTSATFGFNFQLTGGTLVGASPRINTDTGALLSGSGTVQNAGAYWRLTATITNNTTGNTTLVLSVFPATAAHGSGTDSSAATGSAVIYGAQMEVGAFATSYIPTIASTVTRSADVATITGSLFSQWYNQSEGAWIASFSPYVVNFGVVTQISAATNNDRFQLLNDNSGQIAVSTGGVGQGTIDAGTVSAGLTNNLSYAYRTNDTAASLNGGASVADTTVTLPVVDRLCVGATVAPAGFLCGHIRSIRYVPVRAADFQLQQVTT
jgi:hypothetical protein